MVAQSAGSALALNCNTSLTTCINLIIRGMQQSPIESLKQQLATGDPGQLIKLSQQLIDESPAYRLVHAILQIKTDSPAGALNTLQYKNVPPELQSSYNYTRLYANYKLENYSLVISELQPSRKTLDLASRMLLAQSLTKEERWEDAFELYIELLNNVLTNTLYMQNSVQDEHQDILTNLLHVAIVSLDHALQEKVAKYTQDFVKKRKGQVNKEVMINQALLHLSMLDIQTTRDLIGRLLNLIKLDQGIEQELDSDEDYLIATLILDYIEPIDERKTQERIKQYLIIHIISYESLLQRLQLPKSVLPVVLNNLAVLQEKLHPNHHDTLKRIEDAIALPDLKLASSQIQRLKLNRLISQVSRNRINEAAKNLKDADAGSLVRLIYNQKSNSSFDPTSALQQLLQGGTSDNQIYKFLSVASHYDETPQRIIQLFEDTLLTSLPQWASVRPFAVYLLALTLKVGKPSEKILAGVQAAGLLPDLCQYYLQLNQLDKALSIYEQLEKQGHSSANEIRGRISLKFIEQNQWNKAERFLDEVPFPFGLITDIGELEQLETNVQLTKTQRQKSQDLTELVQKRIGKRRKRSRRPKNLPANAPAPNPERWVPKYERKDYRKKKGAILKGRSQGTAVVGKETVAQFTQGASSANVDVSQKQKKNRKKR